MEKKMEATIVYWGNLGIMEKRMEATIMGLYACHHLNRPCSFSWTIAK